MYLVLVEGKLHNGIILDLCEELDLSPPHYETHIKQPPDLTRIEIKGEADNWVDALVFYGQLIEEFVQRH